MEIASIGLLQFSCVPVSDPLSVAKQSNATDINRVVAEIVRNSPSSTVNAFDASKLSRPVVETKSWNACASHLACLWMHAHEQAIQRRGERRRDWEAGRLKALAPFLGRSQATKFSMRRVLVLQDQLMQQTVHIWIQQASGVIGGTGLGGVGCGQGPCYPVPPPAQEDF